MRFRGNRELQLVSFWPELLRWMFTTLVQALVRIVWNWKVKHPGSAGCQVDCTVNIIVDQPIPLVTTPAKRVQRKSDHIFGM